MRYFYDCEFLEDGRTIEPISIGFVAEDGRELYLINGEFPLERFDESPWLKANVLPYLPILAHGDVLWSDGGTRALWEWDTDKAEYLHSVWNRKQIRDQISGFVAGGSGCLELWANYGAYDHICLMQLWGAMVDRDPILPMYTNDLQQMLRTWMINPGSMPQQVNGQHRAIDDARHLRDCYAEAIRIHRARQWQ